MMVLSGYKGIPDYTNKTNIALMSLDVICV